MNLSTAYELKKQISVEMKKGFVFTMYIIVLLILFSSCQNKTKNHVIQLVREWEGKEIQFPPNSVFTIQGKDTIEYFGDNSSYKIVTYIDSIGCTSCKLQLQNWKDFILNLKSATTRLYDTEAKIICIVSKKGAQCIECHHKDI